MTSEIDVTNSLNKNHSNAFFSKKGAKLGAQTDQPLEFSTSDSTILIGIEENIFDYVPLVWAKMHEVFKSLLPRYFLKDIYVK